MIMKTVYSVFIPIPGTELLKHSLRVESHKSVFCYVNEVNFGPPLNWGLVVRRICDESWHLWAHPYDLRERERGWKLNQLPIGVDVINCVFVFACVSVKNQRDRVQRPSWLMNTWRSGENSRL